MHPLSGTGGSAALEASDLSVLPPFLFEGPLIPSFTTALSFLLRMSLPAKYLCLAFLNFFFPWKKKATGKEKTFFIQVSAAQDMAPVPGCKWHSLLSQQTQGKSGFFPPFLLILYWIHLFAWTRKSHWSLLCAIVRGLGFIPDLKPQKNLNIESAQDLTEWRFIYNPIFTISDTQCSRVGFFSSSDQSLTWAEFSKSLAPGLMLVQGKWDDHSGNNLYVGL